MTVRVSTRGYVCVGVWPRTHVFVVCVSVCLRVRATGSMDECVRVTVGVYRRVDVCPCVCIHT